MNFFIKKGIFTDEDFNKKRCRSEDLRRWGEMQEMEYFLWPGTGPDAGTPATGSIAGLSSPMKRNVRNHCFRMAEI